MAQRNERTDHILTRVRQGMRRELMDLRGWFSRVGGQEGRIEMLRGKPGDIFLAKVVDCVMTELGLGVDEPPTSPNSRVRRAVRGDMGPGAKDLAVEE